MINVSPDYFVQIVVYIFCKRDDDYWAFRNVKKGDVQQAHKMRVFVS